MNWLSDNHPSLILHGFDLFKVVLHNDFTVIFDLHIALMLAQVEKARGEPRRDFKLERKGVLASRRHFLWQSPNGRPQIENIVLPFVFYMNCMFILALLCDPFCLFTSFDLEFDQAPVERLQ